MWLDHQKAANGGQPAGTPPSLVLSSTPAQSAAAAAASAAGVAAVVGSVGASGTGVDRSLSATLSPDEAQQTGTPPADSTPQSPPHPGDEANGTAQRAETGVVRSAVRALEFGGEPAVPQSAQAADSSPLTGSPESPEAESVAAHEDAEAPAPADAEQEASGQADTPIRPANGAAAPSVAAEPARSMPPDARLADVVVVAEGSEADGAPAEDGFAAIADNTAELRALLTMHRAEMRAGSEQLRAQFEAGQVRAKGPGQVVILLESMVRCSRQRRRQL